MLSRASSTHAELQESSDRVAKPMLEWKPKENEAKNTAARAQGRVNLLSKCGCG